MPTEDRLLDIGEAAEVLKTTKDYLYRHAIPPKSPQPVGCHVDHC